MKFPANLLKMLFCLWNKFEDFGPANTTTVRQIISIKICNRTCVYLYTPSSLNCWKETIGILYVWSYDYG